MPVFNGETFLRQALDSLLAQDYENFELIISDNASTDATPEICREYLARDNRIQYYRNDENRGARYNFNKVLQLASGKYFLWAAAHDLWHPSHISRCVEILEGDADVVLCYPRALRIDAEGNSLRLATNQLDTRGLLPTERFLRIIRDLSGGDPIYGVMRTAAMKKITISTLWAGDQARLAELSLTGAFAHVPEPLFYWRQIRDESLDFRKQTVPLIVDPVAGRRLIDKELPELWREFGEECLAIIARSSLSPSEKSFLETETKKCLTTRYQVDWGRELKSAALSATASPKSVNVLLTTSAAPAQSPFSTTEKRPPIGIGFLLAVLREAGHEVFFIDNYLQPSDFLETDYLQKNKIDFVGIYANTICFRDTRRMLYRLEYLRQTGQWQGKIIIGGPHTSVALDTIPAFVDYVVQGEGEQAILDIVEGRVTEQVVKCRRIQNLDDLPRPAWDFFIHQPYNWGGDWFPGTPVFTMNTSRGCPFQCTFCSVGSIWGRKYTCFSAERVVADIEYLIKTYGAKGIYFREDNFTVNRERTEKFCHLLIDKGIKIAWACETRVDSLDRDLVALMHQAGLCALYFGVESGSQKILDLLKKGITPEQTRLAFRWCREFGINTAASIIVGVPGETSQDLQQTLDLINEIKPTVVWHNVFVGIPRSPLYKQVVHNHLYEFIDDRGLVYLKGHNQRVRDFYGGQWDAAIPVEKNASGEIANPRISVVMAVYNGAPYLEAAINSILQQTYANFEFIIVNDASTDNTSEILKKYDDCRLRVLTNPENLGLTKSLNRGINAARGQYIARMDADDLSLPHRLEKQLEFLENHPEYALVGSSYYQIDETGSIKSLIQVLTDHCELRTGLWQQNWFGHGTVMMRQAAVVQAGGYDEKFTYAQDYDLWLRLADNHRLANLAEPLYCWRAIASCISLEKTQEQQYFARLAQEKAKERHNLAKIDAHRPESGRSGLPLVSVIVPTFNRPDTLVVALQSILDQTCRDFEIIVVNDYGVDVADIVGWLNQQGNITYVKHDRNRGLAAARNTGLRLARGKYIAYLDDDDLFYPDHLETLVTFLETTDYQVAYTDAHRAHQVKDKGRYVTRYRDLPHSNDFDAERLLVVNQFPVLCLMHEKSCLEKAGLFDETLTTHEDWDLWIRLSFHYQFSHIKKVTCEFTWRQDGSTMTSSRTTDFVRTTEIIYEKYRSLLKEKPHIQQIQKEYLDQYRRALGAPHREISASQVPPESPPRVSIVIPVFNNLDLNRQCLESIYRHTPLEGVEIIAVDNGSTDGSTDYLRQEETYGRLQLISNTTNLGFARACNQGAQIARGNRLVFLNNDTIVQPGWLDGLTRCLEKDEEIGIVGAKLVYPDDTIQHAGVTFNDQIKVGHIYRFFHHSHPAVNKEREFQVVTAACMMIRKALFVAVGGFDEHYQNGFEDVDLCLQIRRLGYKVYYTPHCVVYHLESKTAGRHAREKENALYFISKWRDQIIPDQFSYYQDDGISLELVGYHDNGKPTYIMHDHNVNIYWQEAARCREQGVFSQAIENYRLALQFNPFDHRQYAIATEFAETYELIGDIPEAVKLYQQIVDLSLDPKCQYKLARLQKKLGHFQEAIKNLEQAKETLEKSAVPAQKPGRETKGSYTTKLKAQHPEFETNSDCIANEQSVAL